MVVAAVVDRKMNWGVDFVGDKRPIGTLLVSTKQIRETTATR